jgi:hypothetical protein
MKPCCLPDAAKDFTTRIASELILRPRVVVF